MPTVEATLLYSDPSLPALDTLRDALNASLARLGVQVESTDDKDQTQAAYSSRDWQIVLSDSAVPLAAETLHGAMDSILSQSMIGGLAETLRHHAGHVKVTVLPFGQPTTPATWLAAQRVAHAAASVVAAMREPAALLWHPAHQLVTGGQYAQMATDPTPWTLFASARQARTQSPGRSTLRIDNAADFIGRPILFPETGLPVDQAYAAALAFLRHAVETGAPIPDGHSFGPEDGYLVKVTHATATEAQPMGSFVLRSLAAGKRPGTDSDTAPPLPAALQLSDELVLDQTRERTRSFAISFLMLVLLPPVGLLLLFMNGLSRPNAAKTGLIAMTALAIAMVLGAYVFLNMGDEDTAALHQPVAIDVKRLAD